MIDPSYTLYPEVMDATNLYFHDEPYAYWVENMNYNFCNWVLYKEYNNYNSTCNPNDCIAGISYEEVIDEIKNSWSYRNQDRDMLIRTFRQRSLNDTEYNFKDFIYEE